MSIYEIDFTRMLYSGKREYNTIYQDLKFIDKEAISQQEERKTLLKSLELLGIRKDYNNSKLYVNHLSEGCKLCASGEWSCLFINGICNANCMYCPTEQTYKDDLPQTNTVKFKHVDAYLDYVNYFGFKGISISGGEPLISFHKTVDYIRKIKARFPETYIWIYTNGILMTEEKANILKKIGVNEIRFDIGATDYSLNNLKKVLNIIDVVTVEIPCDPNELELLEEKILKLDELGVNNLNLHNMKLTKHNYRNFKDLTYTYAHGPKITVYESEIAILKLMEFALKKKIKMGINYCSNIYKNRYQGKGSRIRCAKELINKNEEMTSNGYIRQLEIISTEIDKIEKTLQDKRNTGWLRKENSIICSVKHLNHIRKYKFKLKINYFSSTFRTNLSFRNPYKKIKLKKGQDVLLERYRIIPTLELSDQEIKKFLSIVEQLEFAHKKIPLKADKWRYIECLENVQTDLMEVF